MPSVIQKKSYGSATVFWLNKELLIDELQRAAECLLNADQNVRKVVVFGSVAEDRATAFSDVDILIVVVECDRRFVDRAEIFRSYFDDLGIETDLFVYTEREIERTPAAQNILSSSPLQFT